MTITNPNNSIEYTISSTSKVTYAYNFKVDYTEDMQIWYRNSSTATDEHQMTEVTHYNVLDVGQSSGGRFTLTTDGRALLQTGSEMKALREAPFTQLTDYIENSSFPAEAHENALDKLTMLTQQLNASNARNLYIDEQFIDSDVTKVQRSASGFLQWDASGIGIKASFLTTTLFSVSDFYKNQLPLSTAASARDGLGVTDYDHVIFNNQSATFASTMRFNQRTTFYAGITADGPIKNYMKYLKGITCGTFNDSICLDGHANTLVGFNDATLGRYTNFASFQLMKGSSSSFTLAKGTSSSYSTAYFNHLTLACSPIIPIADASNEAMQFGQRHNSDYLGRITNLKYNRIGVSTYEVKPGTIVINAKLYTLATTITKSTLSVSGRIYLYASISTTGELTTSHFTASQTVPIYISSYRGYYWPPDDITKRCYGSIYNDASDSIVDFFMVGNDIIYPTAPTLWSTTLVTVSSIKSNTVSNFGPLVPGVIVHGILYGTSANAATQAVAVHISHTYESHTYSSIFSSAIHSERWTNTAAMGAINISTRHKCYADDSGLIKLFYAARNGGTFLATQEGWTHPLGLMRT